MSTDHRTDTKKESDRINVKENWKINYWCEELNLSAEELKDIVRKVGPGVHDVRLYLAKKLLIRPVNY